MTTRRIALSLVGIVALLFSVIAMLPRIKTHFAPTHIAQATVETDIASGKPAAILKPTEAEAKQSTARLVQPKQPKVAKQVKPIRESATERDVDEESELVLNRNGKEIRVKQEHRPGARFDQPAEATSWYLQKRLPQGETELPVDRYFTAREHISQMEQFSTPQNRLMSAETTVAMDIDSPTAAPFIWTNLGPGNVGGRTRSLIIDPNNTNIMYAGAVAGGIWKSTDAGTSWVALDDFMANIAVTCMAIDPTNSQILYAGTGEGFFNVDGVRGAGIFVTVNGGTTWTRLPTTNNSNFFYVTDIVVSPANATHLYASTRTGVQRSLDSGVTWSTVLVSDAANGANGAMDLVMRTDQATDYIFAAVGTFAQSHIWRNTDAAGAGVWTDVYSEAQMGRTSLAIAPSNQSVIYAMAACNNCGAGTNPNFPTANYTDGLLAVIRSTANGDSGSWSDRVRNNSANLQDTLLLSNPVNGVLTQCGFGTSQFFNQGWYDNQLQVDPTDSNRVWAAGIDVWRSDNGGTNWAVASYWWFQGEGTPPANGDPQLAHADNHVIVFKPGYNGTTNQTMYVGNDGGIYQTNNAFAGNVGYVSGTTPSGGAVTTTSPICGNEFTPGGFFTVPSPVIWAPLNNGYGATQFYHGAVYPSGTTYFGGTQDNGTNRGTDAAGANAWERIFGGDGGYVAVNPSSTNILYVETTGLSIRKSTNSGASFTTSTSGISGDAFPFITVFRMDPTTPTRLWIGGRFMWRTDDSAGSWTATSNSPQTAGSITAMAIAPTNSNIVIDGAASGQLRRTTVGTTATSMSALPPTWPQSFTPRGNGNGTISWLEYDPTNALNVYATISNFNGVANANGTNAGHIYKSTDGGATWSLLDGTGLNTIPDIPVHCIVVVPNNTSRLYAGTDLGVFVSLDGGANWFKETAFPNVVTESLTVNTVAGQTSVFAFTHGRGVFSALITPTAAPATISGQVTTADGQPVAGVTVSLSGSRSLTAITDSNGNYRFSKVDTDGFYNVTPSLTNYHFVPDSRSFSLVGSKTDAVFTASRDTVMTGNVIDSAGFFVRQHYLDFLGREPDEDGFNFWNDQLVSCDRDQSCAERRRINVSAAYFLSIEFQQTGGLVDSLYRASYGRRPLYAEFNSDRQSVAQNIVLGVGDWARQLSSNKQAFVNAWTQRPEFREAYDGLSNAAFVDALITHAGSGFNGDRNALVGALDSGASTRAAVFLEVAENEGFLRAKFNETFVMMEYFGYLRRDPDEDGYSYWLNKLNQFGGNFEEAEMVKAFISSAEYRQRFGN